jgi:hypothetical protein
MQRERGEERNPLGVTSTERDGFGFTIDDDVREDESRAITLAAPTAGVKRAARHRQIGETRDAAR